MKKYSIKKPLLLAAFFSLFLFINLVQAATECPSGQICIDNPIKATSFEELIDSIINFLFVAVLALSSLMIVIAGYYFVTASGDPKKIEAAKKIILYTLIGLGIIMFAKAINSILKLVIGLKQ